MKPPHQLPIASIRIGKRHRKRMGDIESLARSIEAIGLLHPVAIDSKRRLIAGERRIRAFQHLGRTKIPVTVIDLDKIVQGEAAENFEREDFTLSEAVAIKRAIEPLLKAEAKARQGTRTDKHLGKLPTSRTGRAADIAAKHTGKGRRTLDKAEAVIAAAEAEPDNPKIAALVEAMDKSGRANGPYRRLTNMRQAEAIRREPPPLPNQGPYRAAMVDCPWAYEPDDDDAAYRAVLPYSTMSIEQLCAMDVASIMHEDAVLGFWVTNFILVRGLHLPVLKAWGGFDPKTIVTWPKDRPGRGHWAKGQTEHLIIATRGKPVITTPLPDHTTLLRGPFHLVSKGEHSTKPVEAYNYFESRCPAARFADLFSRYRHNERWDCFGDQAPPAIKEAAE
jgi:N6-adenosine-specific RNA methylase IME4/ParB-like chromosome segregation protein Spo0J